MNRIQPPTTATPKSPTARLIGLALDHKDGHKRITNAERFSIIGGSEDTHARMTETIIKTFETLDREGKTLQEMDPREFVDILHKSAPD